MKYWLFSVIPVKSKVTSLEIYFLFVCSYNKISKEKSQKIKYSLFQLLKNKMEKG